MGTNDRGELAGHFALVYPSKYIKAADLGGQDVTVTILRGRREQVEMEGGRKDDKAVFYVADAHGKPLQKTWVAGKTVLKQIAASLGDPDMSKWKGRQVTMFPTTCKGKGGETLECIRVRQRVGRGTDMPAAMSEPSESGPPQAPADEAPQSTYERLWFAVENAGPGQIDELAAGCRAALTAKQISRGEAANLSTALASKREALAGVVPPDAEPPAGAP